MCLKGSLLVNIARGGILDYKSVLHHLQSGHLGGLAIDVAWTEPFDPDDPILKFPNVLITPHVAGVTVYSYRKMAKVFTLFLQHFFFFTCKCTKSLNSPGIFPLKRNCL